MARLTETNIFRLLLALLTAAALSAPTAFAAEPEPEEQPAPEADTEPAEDGAKEETEPEDQAEEAIEDKPEVLAIVNGRVHTVSGGVLPRATVLIEDGIIDAVGARVRVPEHATVIDAAGKNVYPGLIATDSSGIAGRSPIQDDFDPYSVRLPVALAAGITTVVADNTATKLTWGTLENTVLAEDVFVDLSYSSRQPAAKRRLRDAFEDVVQYQRDLAAHERAKAKEKLGEGEESELEPPADDAVKGRGKRYLDLIEGRAIAKFEADTTNDLRDIADFARDFGFEAVIFGGVEAWTVATDLARADVGLVISPRQRRDRDPLLNKPNGSTIENAKILADHGIPVAFLPDGGFFSSGDGISFSGLVGRDLAHYFLTGAYAVRGGMDQDEAVASLSLTPARMLGLDTRIGSIEVGKDGDVIITDGELLDYQTHVVYAVVNGKLAYDKASESLYSHIRPDGDKDKVSEQPADPWPRSLGADW